MSEQRRRFSKHFFVYRPFRVFGPEWERTQDGNKRGARTDPAWARAFLSDLPTALSRNSVCLCTLPRSPMIGSVAIQAAYLFTVFDETSTLQNYKYKVI